jgi:hypothetical protein
MKAGESEMTNLHLRHSNMLHALPLRLKCVAPLLCVSSALSECVVVYSQDPWPVVVRRKRSGGGGGGGGRGERKTSWTNKLTKVIWEKNKTQMFKGKVCRKIPRRIEELRQSH